MTTLQQAAADLASGATTSRDLVEQCLARIADPTGEGARAFTKVHADQARAQAAAMDTLRAENDKTVARLYGINDAELAHLLRSFKGMATKRPEYLALLQAT